MSLYSESNTAGLLNSIVNSWNRYHFTFCVKHDDNDDEEEEEE